MLGTAVAIYPNRRTLKLNPTIARESSKYLRQNSLDMARGRVIDRNW